MKRRSTRGSPYSYRGPRDNKRVLKQFSEMCYGLLVFPAASKPSIAKRLESIGASLGIKATIIGRKAFLGGHVIDIYDDLSSLQYELDAVGFTAEVEHYLKRLESEVKALEIIIEHNVKDSPIEANMNRSVRKFIVKKSAVEKVSSATERSLSEAEKKLECLQHSTPQTGREKRRSDQRIANLKSFIKARQSAADTLSSIVDRLNALESTARLSPGLSGRINRLIHLKYLADFYDKPLRSQKEREKLYLHLYYINENQIKAEKDTDKLDNFVNQSVLGAIAQSAIKSQTTSAESNLVEECSAKQQKTNAHKQKNLNVGGSLS